MLKVSTRVFLEDLVNASGRLLEGSFYTRTADGETQKIEMIESDFVADENGKLVPEGEEVSLISARGLPELST